MCEGLSRTASVPGAEGSAGQVTRWHVLTWLVAGQVGHQVPRRLWEGADFGRNRKPPQSSGQRSDKFAVCFYKTRPWLLHGRSKSRNAGGPSRGDAGTDSTKLMDLGHK